MDRDPATNENLIFRLANVKDQEAWNEFVEIYQPLIARTARKLGLNSEDSNDATQEVLLHLAKVVSSWRPTGRTGSFRGWLIRVARNHMLKSIQRTSMLKSQAGSEDAQARLLNDADSRMEVSTYFNIEFRRQVFMHVVKKIKNSFSPTTWQAFWQTYIDEKSPQHVASDLEISVSAIYVARSRVMSRLQTEIRFLVDDEWQAFMSYNSDESKDPSIEDIRRTSSEDEGK